MGKVHRSFHTLIEQPSGSWAYKQPEMVSVIAQMGLPLGCLWKEASVSDYHYTRTLLACGLQAVDRDMDGILSA